MALTESSTPLAGVHVSTYVPHALHGDGRIWTETNCYTDVWIELLHALGAEPLDVAAYCLSADFEGTQWAFFKPPLEDLREAYGIEVGEMNVWRPVLDHLEEEMALGRLLAVEVDSWYLPDTVGVSYRTEHVKTTVIPIQVDRRGKTLQYLHGSGLHQLEDGDFNGLFAQPLLPPYVELIRLDALQTATPLPTVRALAARHLSLSPHTNPVTRLGLRLADLAPWLSQQDDHTFHQLAFGTCRQCGASAEIAANFVRHLGQRADLDLGSAADDLMLVAEGAKTLQFALARIARGRTVELPSVISPLAESWDRAMRTLSNTLGHL
jgi:hypothetical protein